MSTEPSIEELGEEVFEHDRHKAAVRKLNAEAELLEAQARDIRAQAAHREQATRSNELILSLQKLQIERDIANFGKAEPGKEN